MQGQYGLVCVSGLTPQVVTETIYALGMGSGKECEADLPDTVDVLTTLRGRDLIEEKVLGPDGQFSKLCRDYGWDAATIDFDAAHIHVIQDSSGQPLDDIRNADDNAMAADFITAFIRDATATTSRLHVSLAGGRKTMGYFMGYALSLYGRAPDRLSHVLVNPPFESHRDFFYPPSQPQLLDIAGEQVSTAEATIELADIPFIRLRDGLEPGLLVDDLSFSESVARTQQLLDPPELRIDLDNHHVWLQGHFLKLSDTHFLWLTWMAIRTHDSLQPLPFDEQAAEDLLHVVDLLEGSGASRVRSGVSDALVDAGRGDIAYFERTRTRLNKSIVERSDLYPKAAERYQIQSFGTKPHTSYGLALDSQHIHIEGQA